MMAAGSREGLMQRWKINSEEDVRGALANFTVLRDRLDAFLETNNLKTLP